MQCRDVRAIADAYLDDELLVETNQAVLAHIQTCRACEAELRSRQAFRARLKRAFDQNSALAPPADFPASLAGRLQGNHTAQARPRRWYLPVMAAAAMILFAILMARWQREEPAPAIAHDEAIRPVIDSAIADHLECALGHRPAELPIPLDQSGTYDVVLPGLDAVAESSARGVRPAMKKIGAHLCRVQDRRFGHIVFSRDESIISIVVASAGTAVARYANDRPLVCQADNRLSVACFAAPEHLVFVISDLTASDSLTFANALAPGVRGHLTRAIAMLLPGPGHN